jgi:lipopolysaccharide/colanic/teichoic acid biosynthesis glycosyltransferase
MMLPQVVFMLAQRDLHANDCPVPSTAGEKTLRRQPRQSWYLFCKVPGEFCFALLLLLATAPVVLLALLLVKLTSRGPVLYCQTRLGRGGRPFTIFKIRTMGHNCEHATGPRWATAGDPRVTPIGRILRRTHVDELPQLWNVLRGDMSLVGPRPERPEFVPHLEEAIPHYRERLLVRPGMTGLAQVQLPPDTDLASVRRKLAHDLYYVQNLSLWLDVQIVLSTLCYLARIPFSVTRNLFRVPSGDMIEGAYAKLSVPANKVLQMQPA